MKTSIKIVSLFIVLWISTCLTPQNATAQEVYVDFQVFYNELSPYGTWVESPDYGYAWIPDVAPGFTPYATNGYWAYTDMGWTWVSNYSWGWAPFHYGRWYTDPNYGPMWVPGNEWGPGWVTWRRSANYYGWAPIGPGVSISVAYGNNYYIPHNQYTFISGAHMGRTNINNYYIDNSRNVTIINNSTVINNTRIDNRHHVKYNAGPDRHEIEKRAGRPITPVAIKESNKPGQRMKDNQLQIYRPQVQKTTAKGQRPAPSKVTTYKPTKQQPSQQQRQAQPVKQQQKQAQPKQQPSQQQHQAQPSKQQQPQAQPRQQPSQQQHQAQPPKQQQPSQKQHETKPSKPQSSQPKQTNSSQKEEKGKQSEQNKPPKKLGV